MIDLREVLDADLETLHEHQSDPVAAAMAVFGSRERDDFMAHWAKILADPEVVARTVIVDGRVAGNIGGWGSDGRRYVGYWIGREFWGRGLATEALRLFVAEFRERPLYAWVATSNVASARVLEKAGFIRDVLPPHVGEDGVEEFLYKLP